LQPIKVRVLRPEDLVDLYITAQDMEVAATPEGKFLVPAPGGKARLIVAFATQHLAEQASYEIARPCPEYDPATGGIKIVNPEVATPEAPDSPPIQARAAASIVRRKRPVPGACRR
jgi:hypothetical protein